MVLKYKAILTYLHTYLLYSFRCSDKDLFTTDRGKNRSISRQTILRDCCI